MFFMRRKDGPDMLMLVRITFECIFRTLRRIQLTFVIVDFTVAQYLPYFLLCDLPATHSAFGMLAEKKFSRVTIEPGIIGGNIVVTEMTSILYNNRYQQQPY
jgi:hypothetical protein